MNEKNKKGIGVYSAVGECSQKDIDFWCGQCHFPFENGRCKDKANIRKCWRSPNAHEWHLRHECPFARVGRKCECNDCKDFKDAFQRAGLEYKPSMNEKVIGENKT